MESLLLKSDLTCISVSPNQRIVAVGGRSLLSLVRIEVGDSEYGIPSLLLEKELSTKSASDVAMNPAMENMLAVGSSRRNIELWDLVSFTSRPVLSLDKAAVTRLSWQASDPNTLLIGATDGILRIADVRSQDPVHTIMATRAKEIRDCQFDPHDNCTLAACSDNGIVQTFDSRQPKTFSKRMVVHDGPALCLSYHPSRRGILASGGSSGATTSTYHQAFKLKILAPDREACIVRAIRTSGVSCIAWRGDDSNEIAAGLDSRFDHDIVLWDTEDIFYSPQGRMRGHSSQISRLAFLSNSLFKNTSAYLSNDSSRSREREERENDESDSARAVVSRSSALVLSAGKDGILALQPYKKEFTLKKGNAMCFSSQGFVMTDDFVSPDWSLRNTRGKAHAKFYDLNRAFRQDDALMLAATMRFDYLKSACQYNYELCRQNGKERSMGFWKTLETLFYPVQEQVLPIEQEEEEEKHAESKVQNPNPAAVVESAEIPMGNKSIPPEPSSLLKGLSLLDGSLSTNFHIRSRIALFDQMGKQLTSEIGLDDVKKKQEDMKEDAISHVLVPVGYSPKQKSRKKGRNNYHTGNNQSSMVGDLEMEEKNECVKRALTILVDRESDVFTALSCVLIFFQLDLPLPATTTHIRRWGWAVQESLERQNRFPDALNISRIVESILEKSKAVQVVSNAEPIDSRIGIACATCNEPLPALTEEGGCPNCNTPVAKCAVCRLTVRSMYVTCLLCGHGGHVSHLKEWFAVETQCPRGCGCNCMISPPPSFSF